MERPHQALKMKTPNERCKELVAQVEHKQLAHYRACIAILLFRIPGLPDHKKAIINLELDWTK
jgi:hypothetical protein